MYHILGFQTRIKGFWALNESQITKKGTQLSQN